jgi:hypothetical protein
MLSPSKRINALRNTLKLTPGGRDSKASDTRRGRHSRTRLIPVIRVQTGGSFENGSLFDGTMRQPVGALRLRGSPATVGMLVALFERVGPKNWGRKSLRVPSSGMVRPKSHSARFPRVLSIPVKRVIKGLW